MDPEMERMFLEEDLKDREAKKKEQLGQLQGLIKQNSSSKPTKSNPKAKEGLYFSIRAFYFLHKLLKNLLTNLM
jgi:hypothetical protein